MSRRELDTIRRLEQRARELRSHCAQHNTRSDPWSKCLTEGLVVTGDVIRFLRTGKRPEGPVGRQARLGLLLEELGLLRSVVEPCADCDDTGLAGSLKECEDHGA